DGTACHIRKSTAILDALHKQLGLTDGKHTTDDRLFTVETVSCLGACGLAPTMMVNEQVYPSMTPEKALAVIAELRGKG
ncbi:MAG: NAD(P)H-dependent oxidoreductase subunit E, partial [Oscillospiraceae bacterium]|nr:NAD(P)H-dependent oxidoreductase subunit E [Oscillospiraceae bacterium]